MSGRNVYFLPRAQAAHARSFGAEPRLIVPAGRISAPAERGPSAAPAKLSAADAERLLGIPVRILR